jgi:hypothetical protein
VNRHVQFEAIRAEKGSWLLFSNFYHICKGYKGDMVVKESVFLLSLTLFSSVGYVFTRGGYVELSKKLPLPLGRTLDRCVILSISMEACCDWWLFID